MYDVLYGWVNTCIYMNRYITYIVCIWSEVYTQISLLNLHVSFAVKLCVMCETEMICCVFASGLMCINHTRRLNASLTLPEENKFVFFSTSKFLKKNLLITPKFSSAYTDGGKTNNIRSHYKKGYCTTPTDLIRCYVGIPI